MNDRHRCYCPHCFGKFLKMLGEYLFDQTPQCTHKDRRESEPDDEKKKVHNSEWHTRGYAKEWFDIS
jgi:hypothetical protein